jgi:hypothetical protein
MEKFGPGVHSDHVVLIRGSLNRFFAGGYEVDTPYVKHIYITVLVIDNVLVYLLLAW